MYVNRKIMEELTKHLAQKREQSRIRHNKYTLEKQKDYHAKRKLKRQAHAASKRQASTDV